MSAHPDGTHSDSNSVDEASPRRSRRLLKIGLLVLSALVLLVAFAPTLLSTAPARTPILNYASRGLGIRLAADALDLSWLGEQSVTGLAVESADGRPAAKFGRLRVRRGLLNLIMDSTRLGDIVVSEGEVWPEELMRLGPAEKPPAESPKPPAPETPGPHKRTPLPDSVRISNLTVHSEKGSLRISQADFTDVPGTCKGHIEVAVENEGERGTASLDATLVGLADVAGAPGALGLAVAGTYKDLSLGPICEVVSATEARLKGLKGGGVVSGTLDVSRSPAGTISAKVTCDGKKVWLTGKALGDDEPSFPTLSLNVDATYTQDLITVRQLAVQSRDVLQVDASGPFDLSIGPKHLASGDGNATITMAVAPLAKMFPHALRIPEGVSVDEGQLKAALQVHSGSEGSRVKANADMTDVKGRRDGKPITLVPVHLVADLERTGAEYVAKEVVLTGAFGRVTAQGKLEAFTLNADLKLKDATDDLGQFVDLGPYGAAGTAKVLLTTEGTFEQGIRLSARADLADFLLALGEGRQWEEKEADLTGDALLTFDAAQDLSGVAVSAVKIKSAAGSFDADAAFSRKDAKWSLKAHAGGTGDAGRLVHLVQVYLARQGGSVSGSWQLDASADGTIGESVKAVVKGHAADLKFPVVPVAAPGARGADDAPSEADLVAEARYEFGPSDRLVVDRLDVALPNVFLKASGNVAFPAAKPAPAKAPPKGPAAPASDMPMLEGTVKGSADLVSLQKVLGLFGVLPEGFAMAGSADVTVTASPPKDGKSQVHAALACKNLDVSTDRPWNVPILNGGENNPQIKQPHLDASADAVIVADEAGIVRSVQVSAWSLNAGPGQLKGDATVERKRTEWTYRTTWSGGGSLGPLVEAIAGLTGRQPGAVTGLWKLSGDVDTGAATGTAFNVSASTTGLNIAQAGTAPTKLPDVRLEAATLAKGNAIQVRKLDLAGPGLTAHASGTVLFADAARHQGATGDGSVSLDADLAQLTDVLRPLGVLDKESIMAGKAKLTGKAASSTTGFSGSGTLDVTGLSMHLMGPDLTLQEPTVHVPITFSYATAEDLWKIAIKGMKSAIASGDVDASKGMVAAKTSVQAKCDIKCDGEKVQAAVKSHLPKEMLLSKSWHVLAHASGPLRPQGSWNQRIADLTGEGTVDLGTFDYQGLTGDQGKVQLALANSRLALVSGEKEGSRFRLNEGTVVLGGNADMNASPAPYTLAEKLLVIDSVKLNEKITNKFLKFTSPILHLSVKPTGLLYASLTEARIPLGEGIAQHSNLRGQIWIRNFQAEISGPLATLIQWAGGKTQLPTQELGPFDLDLRDGVFYVRNQTLKLKEGFELEVNGTISLEGPIDITVALPPTGPMLKRFGVSEKNQALLADQELQVPIRGTLDKPKLDEAALAAQVAKLALEATKREGMKDIGKMIEDALKKKKKKSAP